MNSQLVRRRKSKSSFWVSLDRQSSILNDQLHPSEVLGNPGLVCRPTYAFPAGLHGVHPLWWPVSNQQTSLQGHNPSHISPGKLGRSRNAADMACAVPLNRIRDRLVLHECCLAYPRNSPATCVHPAILLLGPIPSSTLALSNPRTRIAQPPNPTLALIAKRCGTCDRQILWNIPGVCGAGSTTARLQFWIGQVELEKSA